MNSSREDTQNLLQSAVSHHQAGRLDDARALYDKVLSLEPKNPNALGFLGLLYFHKGDCEQAINYIGQAIQCQPKFAPYHDNLGMVYMSKGDYQAALDSFNTADRLEGESPDRSLNMGNALQALGRFDQAEAAYRLAIRLQPNRGESHLHLGYLYLEMGRYGQAVDCFKSLTHLNSDSAESYLALGRAYDAIGSLDGAADAFQKALELEPGLTDARIGLASVLRLLKPKGYKATLVEQIISLSQATDVHPQALARVAADQLLYKYQLKGVLSTAEELSQHIDKLASDELLHVLLTRTVNTNPDVEHLLTEIRKLLLKQLIDGEGSINNHWELAISLALQCFANEFIFSTSVDENQFVSKLLLELENSSVDNGRAGEEIEVKLVVIAMYFPLASLACAQALGARNLQDWTAPIHTLIQRTLKEPLDEISMRSKIRSLRPIEDSVSLSVRKQYEENPYPRWFTLPARTQAAYSVYLGGQFPHFSPPDFLNKSVRVLAAGCGTGQEAVIVARTRKCEVVGLDLSLASLSYGARMARDLKVDNLSFVQGDLLNAADLGQQFHVIECSGVLHHMAEPLSGWYALLDCLVPGGVMKIGLYSELASRDVTAAREVISNEGLDGSVQSIKSFRARIMMSSSGDNLRSLQDSDDFYTLSSCRDLLFHVHEQCFTLPQIGQALNTLNLQFIGFDLPTPSTRHRYLEFNPRDRTMTDLSAWERFEQRYPDTFAAMYVFWCQKPR